MHFLRLSVEFEEVGGPIATVGLLVSALTLLWYWGSFVGLWDV